MNAICTKGFQNHWAKINDWISDLCNQRLILVCITLLLQLFAFNTIDSSLPVHI